MTKWDHNVRSWMENLMATAYGIAPVLAWQIAWQIDDIPTPHEYLMVKNVDGKWVPKLDSRKMPIENPNYEQELLEFAKAMAPRFDELKGRQAFARRAAHGFNITLELLRRARNINFVNEVSSCKKWGGGGVRTEYGMVSKAIFWRELTECCSCSFVISSVRAASSVGWGSSTLTASASSSLTTFTSWQPKLSKSSKSPPWRGRPLRRARPWPSWNGSNATLLRNRKCSCPTTVNAGTTTRQDRTVSQKKKKKHTEVKDRWL